MQVRRKTLKPAFWISVRPHRDVMRAVPHSHPRGVRMNYLQAWVLRLQSSRPFLSPSGFATTSCLLSSVVSSMEN
jgi:hypothetical protein